MDPIRDLPQITGANHVKEDSWTLSVIGLGTGGPPSANALPEIGFKIKLQRLKRSIRHWRSTVQHSEKKMCLDLRNKIDSLDNKAESTFRSSTEVEERNNSIKLFANFEHRKVKDLRQKAKLNWACEGDENSHFFHGIINSRRHRSRINGLNIHGNWIIEPMIKDELHKININLNNLFKIKVGNGQSTSFWNDIWIGDKPLVASFPRLYRLETNPDCLVCDRNLTAQVSLSALANASDITPTLPIGLHSVQLTDIGPMSSSNSGPWYHIMKIKDELCKININLNNLFKIKVGNGQSTSFWNDIWIGDKPLVASFPRLYRLETNPDCLVCDRNLTAQVSLSALANASDITPTLPIGLHSVQLTDIGSMSSYFPPGLIFQWVWRREPRSGPEAEELISLVSLLSNLYIYQMMMIDGNVLLMLQDASPLKA
ncbi:cytochrome P450 [Artemisia annua]|uniref:Cytochrome P450 n=1 Tax=Artemisia annua TaxID=35608 RepID=A0A2U1P6U7_ARTAN|nr:cytochrome P450 [Artemisia annua]